MKLKYYGTGSCEGIPALFCKCDNCMRIRKVGGKSVRSRNQACVDGKILLDFPADTLMHTFNGLPLYDIKTLLLTHSHEDHLYIEDIFMRDGQEKCIPDRSVLTVYSSAKTGKKIKAGVKLAGKSKLLDFKALKPYVTYEIEGYEITPIKAHHDPNCDSYNYIISNETGTLLYMHDSGYPLDETWDYLDNCGKKIDTVSLDSAFLAAPAAWMHMGIKENLMVKERLIKNGNADENTKFVINHMSHFHNFTHEELCEYVKPMGLMVSYDGLEIDVK